METNVATVQFEPTLFDKENNIKKLMKLIIEAAENGAKLIVTPEMGTTGYCWYSREEINPYVEVIPGYTTNCFCDIATKYNCYIVLGMPEVDSKTDLYYNTAVLIGPEGIIGKHRKTHPYISEPKWSVPGDLDHQVFNTPIGKIALLICMDIHFIETARIVALRGADIICHISNWLAERTPAPYWINRAFENHCYLIESNRWGLERTVQFSGGSCIINPDGSIQSVIDNGDGVGYGLIDLEKTRDKNKEKNPIFIDRRPELYKELMTNPYVWNPLDFYGLYGKSPLPLGRKSIVSVGQFKPRNEQEYNICKIEEFSREAAEKGAEMLVLPELSVSGEFNGAKSASVVPGITTNKLVSLSIRYKIYLVAGLVEKDGDNYYNTAVLTGPEGYIGKYRKIHLNKSDRSWANPGEEWAVFDIPIGRVGLLIGYDSMFPEAGRVLALRGCDMILCPATMSSPQPTVHEGTKVEQNYPIPTGADPHHWHLQRVRAGENNVYIAFSNTIDNEKGYFGKSGIFSPETFTFPRHESILYEGEGITSLEIDTSNLNSPYPTNVVRRKDLLIMRQPHFYKDITVTDVY